MVTIQKIRKNFIYRKMKNQYKNKKRFLRNLAYGAVGLAILGVSYITLSDNRNYLKPEEFDKANWIEFYNENGRIWSCYMNENIPKNQSNWHGYIDKVREKNKGKLEGRILLPDLDGDGKVGK